MLTRVGFVSYPVLLGRPNPRLIMASGVHDDPSDVDSPSSNKESSGDSVVTQATAPPSVMATAAAPKLDAPFKAAPFWSLYRYADRWDWLWMIFGFIGAIANGKSIAHHEADFISRVSKITTRCVCWSSVSILG